MNVALSSIIVIFLFLPGIIFRRAYFSAPFSYRVISTNILFDIANALLPAFILHIIGLKVCDYIGFTINFHTIEKLFSNLDYTSEDSPFVQVGGSIKWVFVYNLCITLFAFFSGHLFRHIVIRFDLDKKWQFLHFNNTWYYLFSGRVLDKEYVNRIGKEKFGLPAGSLSVKNDLFVYVDLMVETLNDGVILYKGILEEYTLARNEGLECIRLSRAEKQKFRYSRTCGKDKLELSKTEGKKVPGHSIVIPYSEVKNVNVRYIFYKEE